MAKTVEEKIKAVNKILQDGEPANISVDSYSGYSGYKPQFIVDAMNVVFGIGSWGFEEIATDIVTSQTEKGTASLAVTQVKVWLKDIAFQPVGWGQSRITKGDVGDAKKGAQTDAIKKALSYFSIGNRAYHGLLRAEVGWNGQKSGSLSTHRLSVS
ncbi:MAG: Rad52/Rad22 family DNA repair protein [Syntrophales bacterium]